MTRLLALATGATCGYLVGWLAGSNVLKMAEGRRLGRPEPRTALSAPVESPESRIGRENGAQWLDQDELHDQPDYQEAMRRAKFMPWEPGVDLTPYLAALDAAAAECGCGPDRKDDTDEGIE